MFAINRWARQANLSAFCLVLTLLGLSSLLGAVPSDAQDLCVPYARSVPSIDPDYPMWWPGGPGETTRTEIDDPRWNGALLRTFGGEGTGQPHVVFRALRYPSGTSPQVLFLSWWVKIDPMISGAGLDRILIAIDPDGGHPIIHLPDVLLKIRAYDPAAGAVEAAAPYRIRTRLRDDGDPFVDVNDPSAPAWPDGFTAAWFYPQVDGSAVWAIHLRIPLAAHPDFTDFLWVPDTFQMYFKVQVAAEDSLGNPTTIPYEFPAGAEPVGAGLFDGDHSDAWQSFRLADTHADCIRGVSIARLDIGSDNVPESEIEVVDGANRPATNTLFARPLNETGATIPAGDVWAKGFRIANWGTQIDDPGTWDPVTCNNTPETIADIHDVPSVDDKGYLECEWELSHRQVCEFKSDYDHPLNTVACSDFAGLESRRKHQCMLVELEGEPGITFTHSSVYRNMDFDVPASTFTREAEVSVEGLALPPGEERDVFLYVKTRNMPHEVPRERDRDGWRPGKKAVSAPPAAVAVDHSQSPTYVVHAYHDTGETITENSVSYKVLRPQTSFGYTVKHEGDLEGWRHRLEGDDLVPVAPDRAPNFYQIPVDGAATVTTTVVAVEPSRFSLSLHVGTTKPQGVASSVVESGPTLGLDLEYRIGDRWAAELFLGYDQFDGQGGPDLDLVHLSLNGKYYFPGALARPFVLAGVGVYDPSPGSTELGYNAGAGVELGPWSKVALDFTARYHVVDLNGSDFKFLTYHAGLRIFF